MENRKDNNTRNLIITLVLIVVFFGTLFYLFSFMKKSIPELNHGESVPEFCGDKCGGKDYHSSNNNTEFNFIRCGCVTGLSAPHGRSGIQSPMIEHLYFNSKDGLILDFHEVKLRIEGK